jgi:uncharacterized SAM-dependent methyltransferase
MDWGHCSDDTVEIKISSHGQKGQQNTKEWNEEFARHVEEGLSLPVKTLSSMYFYDDVGSEIYAKITECEDYYPTRTEFEILSNPIHQTTISDIIGTSKSFNLVELGAGDGRKTTVLLRHFIEQKMDVTYIPIDISQGALDSLEEKLKTNFDLVYTTSSSSPSSPTSILLPVNRKRKAKTLTEESKKQQLKIRPINSDNITALSMIQQEAEESSSKERKRTVVMFLGSSIGNVGDDRKSQANWLTSVRQVLLKDDLILIGFDLAKDPDQLVRAYSDRDGLTTEFNMNLLRRINNELGGDFDLSAFKHHATYAPKEQVMESYLISTKDQTVTIKACDKSFSFSAWECMHLECSFKFTEKIIQELAETSGFTVSKKMFDKNVWFCDALLVAK